MLGQSATISGWGPPSPGCSRLWLSDWGPLSLLLEAEAAPSPRPCPPDTHRPRPSRAAHFFRASRTIALLLLPIFFFFFYLIKSHPPRIISPDFLVFTRLTRAITL